MVRPRRPSYKTCLLVYKRLLEGPLWLEDWQSTGIKSRSTVNNVLKWLYSKGLLSRKREGHKIMYRIKEPLHNSDGILRTEGLPWLEVLYKDNKRERRKRRTFIIKYLRKYLGKEEIKNLLLESTKKIFDEIDYLIDDLDNKELLNNIPDWEKISISDLYTILSFNKMLTILNLHRQICPYCLSLRMVYDCERNEYVCSICGHVINDDDDITIEQRLKLIRKFLEFCRAHDNSH